MILDKDRLRRLLPVRNRGRSGPGQPLIGYDRYLSHVRGRALLSYLPDPVKDELDGKPENEFSNRGIARTIPRALNELGYIVDIVSWDDKSTPVNKSYDILIQHGGINYDSLRNLVKKSGKKIYFSTGSYWKYHNVAEQKRFDNFKKRHGFRPSYDRLVTHSEERATREADAIIAIGNQQICETYQGFSNVDNLDLGCYRDNHFDAITKNHSRTKNSFLFFAGAGGIHKGLDLTIEAFLKLPQHLYIMAYVEPALLKYYEEAFSAPNIHLIGPGNFRSPEFYKVMDSCSFAILPSCSEGQPGSMVECLNQGLIPVVTRDVHLSVPGFGFTLEQATISKIQQIVKTLSKLDELELSEKSGASRKAAITSHSPDLFRETFKAHVNKVIDDKSQHYIARANGVTAEQL